MQGIFGKFSPGNGWGAVVVVGIFVVVVPVVVVVVVDVVVVVVVTGAKKWLCDITSAEELTFQQKMYL